MKVFGNRLLRFSRRYSFANAQNVLFCQFRAPSTFSPGLFGLWKFGFPTSLFHRINTVLDLCSKPQMARVYTGAIVSARTIVKDARLVLGNGVMHDYPRKSMASYIPSSKRKYTVSIAVPSDHPKPATVRTGSFVNVSPKVFEFFRCWIDWLRKVCDSPFRLIHTHIMFGLSDGRSATTGAHCVLICADS